MFSLTRFHSVRMLKMMLWKNWLLKKRHILATSIEVLLPLSITVMLMYIRSFVDTNDYDDSPGIRAEYGVSTFYRVGDDFMSPSVGALLARYQQDNAILAFAPNSSWVQAMVKSLSHEHPGMKDVASVFEDEKEVEHYVRSAAYGESLKNPKVGALVVWKETGPQRFDYTLRLNATGVEELTQMVEKVPCTRAPYVIDYSLEANLMHHFQYARSGFMTLQAMVDSYIIRATGGGGNATSSSRWAPLHVGVAPFPVPAYSSDIFQSVIKGVLGLLNVLAFLFPVSRLIGGVMTEKESRVKEVMQMMGLYEWVFYASWFIAYTIQFAITGALLAVVSSASIFPYSDASLLFVYFATFGASTVALCFLLTTFFSRAKTAAAVGTLLFLSAFFPYYTVVDESVSNATRWWASLLSPTAFALGSISLADYEGGHVGLRWSNMWLATSSTSFLSSLLMMFFDTWLYLLLGWYLDNVLPSDYGLHLPWNFPLHKDYWMGEARARRQRKAGKKHHLPPELAAAAKGYQRLPHRGETPLSVKSGDGECVVEEVQAGELELQEEEGRCVQVAGLRKVFNPGPDERVAVDGLSMTLYEGQIFALLGHNGAGKTTTINMLTGLMPPTGGAAVVRGFDLGTEMRSIRKFLGVCPQQDVLLPDLTVREHLELFAVLKKVPRDSIRSAVASMMEEVGLASQADCLSRDLSGGMKRKLSLGIAMLGNSKLVVLDEPTSGMDPYSMRAIWRLIKRQREGRIILLTTHAMTEADVLADRIAIMSQGQLRCCGSPLYLKRVFGEGYTLTVVTENASGRPCPLEALSAIVTKHIPTAKLLSHVGAEMSWQLPHSSLRSFEALFREIDVHKEAAACDIRVDGVLGVSSYGISGTTLEDVFLHLAAAGAQDDHEGSTYAGSFHGENSVHGTSSVWAAMGTSAARGEEGRESTVVSPFSPRACSIRSPLLSNPFLASPAVHTGANSAPMPSVLRPSPPSPVLESMPHGDEEGKGCGAPRFGRRFVRQFWALVAKRAAMALRDKKSVAFALVIPVLVLLLGLCLLMLQPVGECPSLLLDTAQFNPHLFRRFSAKGWPAPPPSGGPMPFNMSASAAQMVAAQVTSASPLAIIPPSYRFPHDDIARRDAIAAAGAQDGGDLLELSEYLMETRNASLYSRYGAAIFREVSGDNSSKGLGPLSPRGSGPDALSYCLLHNTTGIHAAPTFVNVINAALLQLAYADARNSSQGLSGDAAMSAGHGGHGLGLGPWPDRWFHLDQAVKPGNGSHAPAVLRVRSHPLPRTAAQKALKKKVQAYAAGIMINVAFAFIPASFAISVVKEIEVKAKHQQLLSGMSLPAHWVSIFLWDSVSYLLPATLSILLLMIFDVQEFIGEGALKATSLLFVAFGPASAALAYCMSFLFDNHTAAQNGVLLFGFFSGLVLVVGSTIMGAIPATRKFNRHMKAGAYFALCLLLEWVPSLRCLQQARACCHHATARARAASVRAWRARWPAHPGTPTASAVPPTVPSLPPSTSPRGYRSLSGGPGGVSAGGAVEPLLAHNDVNYDVATEATRVMNGPQPDDLVCLVNLHKCFHPTNFSGEVKMAVRGLSFGVKRGECFGFLGHNGAGKTTTLAMLSGELAPTEGTAYIAGMDVTTNRKAARKVVGYCPQFDPLLELLTPREHLLLYARLKCLPDEEIPQLVDTTLGMVGLRAFASKAAGTLSGGNRRKLSLAVALIGHPPILFLDEPSTGMDPVARRRMWSIINRITLEGNCAILLTTHSMEEAEALCTRIGIMVDGSLRCLGSPSQIKHCFGRALQLEVKLAQPPAEEIEALCRRLADAALVGRVAGYKPFDASAQAEEDEEEGADEARRRRAEQEERSVRGGHQHRRMLSSSMLALAGGDDENPLVTAAGEARLPLSSFRAFVDGLANEPERGVMPSEAWEALSSSLAGADVLDSDAKHTARVLCESWCTGITFSRFKHAVLKLSPEATVAERNGAVVRWQLPMGKDTTLARVFGFLEANKEVMGLAEYSVGQTSLQTIFNSFAQQQEGVNMLLEE
eukprot:jgi/Mesvir1/24977/Mv25104-RA.2